MSEKDVSELLQKSDYMNVELNISENKYTFLSTHNKLFLHYFKFNLLKREWDFHDMASEVFHRLQLIKTKCEKKKKKIGNLNLSLNYDMLLKENDNDSYYVYCGNSAHSILYNPLESTLVPLTEFTLLNVYNILAAHEELDLNKILTENCPSSKNVVIDRLLSINVTAIYTKHTE